MPVTTAALSYDPADPFVIANIVVDDPHQDANAALAAQHSGDVIKPVLTW